MYMHTFCQIGELRRIFSSRTCLPGASLAKIALIPSLMFYLMFYLEIMRERTAGIDE